MNTYDFSEYYPAVKVAEILGLEKNTILNRCRNGLYEGAIKTDKEIHPPHGQWLVPKRLIDNPHMVQDVATLTRQINPMELERAITGAITQAVTAAIEPLSEKLEQQAESIKKLQIDQSKIILNGIKQAQIDIEPIVKNMEKNNKNTNEIVSEMSRIKNSESGFGGGFITGIILTIVVLGIFYYVKFM